MARDGKGYCRQHDPEAVKVKRAKAETKYQAEVDAQNKRRREGEARARKLGGESDYDVLRRRWTGGVVLTSVEADKLIERLGK